ncbi:MAG TPA: TonB-dependent receptor [Alphaproteobacteria bacterium]|jgi:outer membrane receptor protein involved in Fe transport|nr:TonB-dependent receptor [Alphaproteobacteria bacterium]
MSHMSDCRKPLFASTALVSLMLAFPTAAQNADAPPAAAPAVPGQMEEITVTATRRSESLSKVSESVSAFGQAKMEVLNVKSFADLAKFTPGVDFDPDSNAISIRGIKSDAGSATTGIYIDDTPIQLRSLGLNANNALPYVFDLDRVEILRGPQGTLFGAGSEGGTVRYITPQPSLTDYSGQVHTELSGTEGGGMNFEGGLAVGGPIVEDKLGFRISGWARRDGGYIDKIDPYNGQLTEPDTNRTNTYVVRAAFTVAPIDNLTITPAYNFQQRSQNNYNQYWVGLSDRNDGKFIDGTPENMRDDDRFDLVSMKVQYDLDDIQLISNSSYFSRSERLQGYSGTLYNLSYFQQITSSGSDPQGNPCSNNCAKTHPVLLNSDGINLPGFGPYTSQNFITNKQSNVTEEFRVQSTDKEATVQWVAGVFYAQNMQNSNEEINDPQLPALTQYLWGEKMVPAWGQLLLPNGDDYVNDTHGHDRQVALFGDVTVNITDQWKFTAGLRYAWTHFDFRNLNTGAQDLLDNGGKPATPRGKEDEEPVTPKVSLSYQVTPDDMIYGTIAEGYRIGGASPPLPLAACGGPFPTQYESDTTWSYEIGTKDRFLDRRLQISTSAYYVEWNNIQQAIYVNSCGIQYTANVGDAISEGFDFDAQYQITDNLQLSVAIGYTEAKYTKSAIDPSTVTHTSKGALLARAGDSLDVVPWTGTIGLQYNFLVGDDQAFVRADYEFTSRRHTPIIAEDPQTEYFDPGLHADPATNLVSLRTGITLDQWEFNLFMDNVFDAHPQLALQHQDEFTKLYTAETFRPRTTGVTASYHF